MSYNLGYGRETLPNATGHMLMGLTPVIGNWYRGSNRETFEVVAYDLDEDSVAIQYFDGTLEELELESWQELVHGRAAEPEDWSGSMDVEPDDYGLDLNLTGYEDWQNPLD